MLFNRLNASAASPNPITDAGNILDQNIIQVPLSMPNTNAPPRHFVLSALDESQAITVRVFAEVEPSPEPQLQTPKSKADRIWRFVEELTGVAGEITHSTEPLLPGNYYAQVTTGTGAGVIGLLGVV